MSKLLINEHPLQVLPSLAVAVGLNEAIILQQIHYWLTKSQTVIGGHRWVYNSVSQWREQFPFWSDDTIARALKNLRKPGIVIAEQLSKDPRDRSLFYRIDYSMLPESPRSDAGCTTAECGNDAVNLRQSLYRTETTSETTAEKKAGAVAPTPKTTRKKKEDTTLQDWIDALPEDELAIREDDPLYQDGIPVEMLLLAWAVFKERHATSGKKYTDWRAAFRDCVRRDYLKLWAIDREGTYYLTTAGKQAAQRLGVTV